MIQESVGNFKIATTSQETKYGNFYHVLIATETKDKTITVVSEGTGRRLNTAKALAFQKLADMYRGLARNEEPLK